MAEILDEFANGARKEEVEAFADQIVLCTHRTIQQRIASLFVATIERWASLPSGQYDLRNRATVELCQKIVKATGDKYDRHLPLI